MIGPRRKTKKFEFFPWPNIFCGRFPCQLTLHVGRKSALRGKVRGWSKASNGGITPKTGGLRERPKDNSFIFCFFLGL
jgi:hypothetical protein